MKKPLVSMVFALAAAPVFATPNIQPGMWEITMKMEMSGMPAAMPPTTVRHCIKPTDIASGHPAIPQNPDKKCEMKDLKVQGNTSSWSMVCKGENAMTGSGTVTYSGNSYSGTSTMAIARGGKTMNMTQVFSGKRVGDCN